MAKRSDGLTFGFPRMHKETGERRDFLPDLVAHLADRGAQVFVESGLGSGMGLGDADYTARSTRVHTVDRAEVLQKDVVLVLRAPTLEEFDDLKPGATLVSMLHFSTRPGRVRRLRGLGVDAVSLDGIVGDEGHRLVENMRAVAWNGVEAGFDALARTSPERVRSSEPVRATLMGIGQVGKHAVEAATKYGDLGRSRALASAGAGGVEATVIGRQLTRNDAYMRERLRRTDVLIDSTQRADPTRPLVPNEWIESLPDHAVVVDLVVDPYILSGDPPTVRSIEGIPQGNLDQYVFTPDDPRWDLTVPPSIASRHRRTTATCYSWPGVHPRACMEHYAKQLLPLLDVLVRRRGARGLRATGDYHERALVRGSLDAWAPGVAVDPA